ncbi:hypothetical protein V5O48_015473 [Marasmius crinis-equi]|uniref:Uncharacterized protein n=1 Tax=Marasmius crinis-equi TaxID=585013 RepID=A0ABR3EUI8_9AGAR
MMLSVGLFYIYPPPPAAGTFYTYRIQDFLFNFTQQIFNMTSHLRDLIKQAARAEQGPDRLFWTYVPPAPVERSFDEFTEALARAYLVARCTPESRTAAFTEAESDSFGKALGVRFTARALPSSHERKGNLLEARRMVLTSLIRWMEVWKSSMPEGVNRRLLYMASTSCMGKGLGLTPYHQDLFRMIRVNASFLQQNDQARLGAGEKIFPYEIADWRQVMAHDLAACNWDFWVNGA